MAPPMAHIALMLRSTKMSIHDVLHDEGRQSRVGHRDNAHHREGDDVTRDMLAALIGQEPAQSRVRGRVQERERALADLTPNRQLPSP